MRLYDAGNAVQAGRLQHPAPALVAADRRPTSTTRASDVKRLSTSPHGSPDSETQNLYLMVAGEAPSSVNHRPVARRPTPAGGARRRAGGARLDRPGRRRGRARLGWLTDDYYLDHCLSEAKLSLFECLAVAQPNYEDVFCLGQHAMKDTGACVVIGAGGAVPIDIAVKPLDVPPVRTHAPPVHHRRKT